MNPVVDAGGRVFILDLAQLNSCEEGRALVRGCSLYRARENLGEAECVDNDDIAIVFVAQPKRFLRRSQRKTLLWWPPTGAGSRSASFLGWDLMPCRDVYNSKVCAVFLRSG